MRYELYSEIITSNASLVINVPVYHTLYTIFGAGRIENLHFASINPGFSNYDAFYQIVVDGALHALVMSVPPGDVAAKNYLSRDRLPDESLNTAGICAPLVFKNSFQLLVTHTALGFASQAYIAWRENLLVP